MPADDGTSNEVDRPIEPATGKFGTGCLVQAAIHKGLAEGKRRGGDAGQSASIERRPPKHDVKQGTNSGSGASTFPAFR